MGFGLYKSIKQRDIKQGQKRNLKSVCYFIVYEVTVKNAMGVLQIYKI